jgi:hypothetical protein
MVNNIDDTTYYIELIQKLAEELLINDTNGNLNELINNIRAKKLSVSEIEDSIRFFNLHFNLQEHKATYIRLYNDTTKKWKAELDAASYSIQRIEDDIDHLNNHIENVLKVNIEQVLSYDKQ